MCFCIYQNNKYIIIEFKLNAKNESINFSYHKIKALTTHDDPVIKFGKVNAFKYKQSSLEFEHTSPQVITSLD